MLGSEGVTKFLRGEHMAMSSSDVITYAPMASALGAWLFVICLYCSAPWSNVLNMLSLVIGSMTLGALIVAYPGRADC